MPLILVRNDITLMAVDAIVNAANETLLGGGGVDGAIHRAAGPELLAECRTLGGCPTGSAKITKGYQLPSRHVIHTVGPVWHGGDQGEREKLVSCYRSSLELARRNHCESVAFPLISAGVYGYPKEQAFQIAVDTISGFLMELEEDMTVYLVVFDRSAYHLTQGLFPEVASYIDDHYVDTHSDSPDVRRARANQAQDFYSSVPHGPAGAPPRPCFPRPAPGRHSRLPGAAPGAASTSRTAPGPLTAPSPAPDLIQALGQLDESFSQMLLRKIDEAGITDAQCYKKANIDRKLFSKIRSDIHYKPSKPTAMAFAIALELPLGEAREMLEKAGFAFSHSSKFDVIVEYFIARGNYNIFEINEALFAFDQSLLGG